MSTFLQVLITGLGRGAVYALLALGFVIIYKATEVVNFAHGSIALVGGYFVFVLHDKAGLPWILAAIGGIAAAAILALLIERVLLSNARLASHDSLAILCIGLDTLLFTEIIRRLGVSDNPNLFPSVSPLNIGSVSIQGIYLVSMIAALVLIGIDPGPRRWSPLILLVVLFVTISFHAFFGVILTGTNYLLAPNFFETINLPWLPDPFADQYRAGEIAWGVGEVPTLILALMVARNWVRQDRAETKRKDRQARRDGDAELLAYNEMLAQRRRETERMGG